MPIILLLTTIKRVRYEMYVNVFVSLIIYIIIDCKFGSKGMVHLSENFTSLKLLRKLNLAGNVIETTGIKYFCGRMNNLPNLVDLDLSCISNYLYIQK